MNCFWVRNLWHRISGFSLRALLVLLNPGAGESGHSAYFVRKCSGSAVYGIASMYALYVCMYIQYVSTDPSRYLIAAASRGGE